MNFVLAVQQMTNGAALTRTRWKSQLRVQLVSGKFMLFDTLTPFILDLEDVTAKDWEYLRINPQQPSLTG